MRTTFAPLFWARWILSSNEQSPRVANAAYPVLFVFRYLTFKWLHASAGTVAISSKEEWNIVFSVFRPNTDTPAVMFMAPNVDDVNNNLTCSSWLWSPVGLKPMIGRFGLEDTQKQSANLCTFSQSLHQSFWRGLGVWWQYLLGIVDTFHFHPLGYVRVDLSKNMLKTAFSEKYMVKETNHGKEVKQLGRDVPQW